METINQLIFLMDEVMFTSELGTEFLDGRYQMSFVHRASVLETR
jgi:hypothetical protein